MNRSWRLRFSLLTLLIVAVFFGAIGGIWWRWEPWVVDRLLRHDGIISDLQVSKDGRFIVTASYDRTVRIWDAASGSELVSLPRDRDVGWVVLSPDGEYVAIADRQDCWPPNPNDIITVWEWRKKRQCCTLPKNEAVFMAFSPDGKIVATGTQSGALWVWQVDSGKGRSVLPRRSYHLNQRIYYVENGERLLVVQYGGMGKGQVRIFTLASLAEIACFGVGSDACLMPDFRHILTRLPDSKILRILDLNGKEVRVCEWQCADNIGLHEFSPDGRRVLTVGGETGAYFGALWDLEGRTTTVVLGEHSDYFTACFSQDGRFILTDSDSSARLWDSCDGKLMHQFQGPSDVRVLGVFVVGSRVLTLFLNHDDRAVLWSRRRPEYWWGVAWLPEFWIAVLCASGLLIIFGRKMRRTGRALGVR